MDSIQQAAPQLLRVPYPSKATGVERDYFLYLPAGYNPDSDELWPVILFLHGGGERGDGKKELDYVLLHGPLGEAWIQRRDLPFIIIGPQLPVFGMDDQVALRADTPAPRRLEEGVPPRRVDARSELPMSREINDDPSDIPYVTEAWGVDGAVRGWQECEADLLDMVDTTLRTQRADPDRVYLTGLSYGGYGAWHMAAAHPERWAAIAPMCGGGNPALAHRLAEGQLPTWIFQGGRDVRIKPQWIYPMANAMEAAGHKSVRLTIHEDLTHNVWTRPYAGEDLYSWFLQQRRGQG